MTIRAEEPDGLRRIEEKDVCFICQGARGLHYKEPVMTGRQYRPVAFTRMPPTFSKGARDGRRSKVGFGDKVCGIGCVESRPNLRLSTRVIMFIAV